MPTPTGCDCISAPLQSQLTLKHAVLNTEQPANPSVHSPTCPSTSNVILSNHQLQIFVSHLHKGTKPRHNSKIRGNDMKKNRFWLLREPLCQWRKLCASWAYWDLRLNMGWLIAYCHTRWCLVLLICGLVYRQGQLAYRKGIQWTLDHIIHQENQLDSSHRTQCTHIFENCGHIYINKPQARPGCWSRILDIKAKTPKSENQPKS